MTFSALIRNVFSLYGLGVYLAIIVGYFGIRAGELTSVYVFSILAGFTAFFGLAILAVALIELFRRD